METSPKQTSTSSLDIEQQQDRHSAAFARLERGVAYDYFASLLETECVRVGPHYYDATGDATTQPVIDEAMRYLEARGLLERAVGHPEWIRILDESHDTGGAKAPEAVVPWAAFDQARELVGAMDGAQKRAMLVFLFAECAQLPPTRRLAVMH